MGKNMNRWAAKCRRCSTEGNRTIVVGMSLAVWRGGRDVLSLGLLGAAGPNHHNFGRGWELGNGSPPWCRFGQRYLGIERSDFREGKLVLRVLVRRRGS